MGAAPTAGPKTITMASALETFEATDRDAFGRRCQAELATYAGLTLPPQVETAPGTDGKPSPAGAQEAQDLLAATFWSASGMGAWVDAEVGEPPDANADRGLEAFDELLARLWAELAEMAGAGRAEAQVVAVLAPSWEGDAPHRWRELLVAARSAAAT
jgi:hypothetical protein